MTKTMYCPNCEEERPFTRQDRNESHEVRGETIALSVPLWVCPVCQETVVDEKFGDTVEHAFAEYRRRHRLLTSTEIKAIREKYELSQQAFAQLLGMSVATINRYEGGSIQDAPQDALIRACSAPSVMRDQFDRRGNLLSPRQQQDFMAALALVDTASHENPAVVGGAVRITDRESLGLLSGFRDFSYDRYASTVLWFCKELGGIPQTKMNKLLFYTDFLHYRATTVSLTGAAYQKMQYGPVPVHAYALRELLEKDLFIDVCEVQYQNGNVGEEYRRGPNAGEVHYSFDAHEKAVLEFVVLTFGKLTPKQISDKSHEEKAWIETPNRDFISYQKALALSVSVPSL